MKVLLCNKFYRPVGGPETVMLDTMCELEGLGHTVIPFAMAHPDNLDTEYSHYFVPNIDYKAKMSKRFTSLFKEASDLVYSREARDRIEKLVSDTRPDIAHAHNIYHQLSPSILAALKNTGIPTVLTLHDGKLLCANMLFLTHGRVCDKCGGRKFYHAVANKCVKDSYPSSLLCFFECTLHRFLGVYERNVDLFITPSNFLKSKLVEHKRLKEQQIKVLPNYADVKSVTPNFNPGAYGFFAGRLEPLKGVMTLLKSCKQVSDFPIKLAGRGPLLEDGQRYVDEEGLDLVDFLGFRTGSDLASLFRESRFVVLPSECYENCPMTILEAFAAGKPVIASKLGGIPELIEHGVDGLLFEPGNVDELAACMRQLIDKPNMATEMGRRGRLKAEEHYSIEMYMTSLLEIYKSLLR